MRNLVRLIHIVTTLARYRLDELLEGVPAIRAARIVRLIPWGRKRLRDEPRGVRFRLAIQDLGPIFVKFGQILSTRRDLLPHDVADELAKLQEAVPPFPGEIARELIESQLQMTISSAFQDFDETPLASASIAQVHAARLADGREVVVKVVRPGIEKRISRDIDLLRRLARLVQKYHPDGDRIRPVDIVTEFEHVIFNELDMQREGANASLLRRNFENSEDLYIPEVHWPLTRKRVLVMERVKGLSARRRDDLLARGVDLEKLARRGIRIFYGQVFRDNLFHADMHPGNFLVDATDPADPSFIALDFGIVATLSPKDLYYIGENFLAIFNKEYRRVAELHVEAGWVPPDTRIDELEGEVRTVCEPNFTRPLEEVSFAEMVVSLFQVAHRYKLTLQPQLIMLQKTLLNIEAMCRELYPSLNLWEVAKPELESIYRDRNSPDRTARRIGRQIPGWISRAPEVPGLLLEYLERAGRGELSARISSQDLAQLNQEMRRSNRRTTGIILAAGLVVASSILAAFQVEPLVSGYSVPAAGGLVLALLAAASAWRSS